MIFLFILFITLSVTMARPPSQSLLDPSFDQFFHGAISTSQQSINQQRPQHFNRVQHQPQQYNNNVQQRPYQFNSKGQHKSLQINNNAQLSPQELNNVQLYNNFQQKPHPLKNIDHRPWFSNIQHRQQEMNRVQHSRRKVLQQMTSPLKNRR